MKPWIATDIECPRNDGEWIATSRTPRKDKKKPMNEKIPCVYILANHRNGTLYIGVTSHLINRIWQHKHDLVEGFTKRYALHRLVYYEVCPSMESAIVREKQLKAGSRTKKISLIEHVNPEWEDLYERVVING